MNEKQKRISLSTLIGGILGIFCVIGVGYRLGIQGNEWYLIGMWYNRVIMGLLIGFSGSWIIIGEKNTLKNAAIRGLLLGLIVTSSIFLATALRDPVSWFAGITYGIIIDLVTTWFIQLR